MSRTFTKLFSSITESTVWCEPDRTRLVWICMLAMADQHGRVWGSIPGLANRARVPVEDARAAIDTFLAPDVDSRTKDFEGRRIEIIDGGWRLLNHEKYRAIRDEESVKESKRRYINTRRAAEREAVDKSRTKSKSVEPCIANAEAEAELKTIEPSVLVAKGDRKVLDCPFQELVDAYHQDCPSLPRVVVLTNMRMKHARARWVQVMVAEKWSKAENLEWFRDFFKSAERSDFLCGRAGGKRAWRASFEWLMNSENFAKVVEGNYVKERA